MDKIILFAALVVFPFGQILKIGNINLFDALILMLSVVAFKKIKNFPKWYFHFLSFVAFGLFSSFVNWELVSLNGLLYVVRLLSYSMVGVYVLNNFKSSREKDTLLNKLLAISVCAAVFGWIQYLFYSDVRALAFWEWDDHYLRMVGTFLDPTFLAIILVFGIAISLYKNKTVNFLTLFLTLSLAFTYSRAGYLSLLAVLVMYAIKFKNVKQILLLICVFGLFVYLVPKNIGEGTTLSRTASVNQRLTNYENSIDLMERSPLMGHGYNNICQAKLKFLAEWNENSNSCSGLDSSLLFILATTGTVGLMLFIGFIFSTTKFLPNSQSYILFSSFVALLVHSMFSNSLVYPHVMFWMFSLLGLQREVKN